MNRFFESLLGSFPKLLRKIYPKKVSVSPSDVVKILETAHDAFISIDTDSRILIWNQQAEATFGWTKREAIGSFLPDLLIPKEYRKSHLIGLSKFLSSGEGPVIGKTIEMPAQKKDGTIIPIELTVTTFRQDDTYIFNAFLHDISERKRANKIQKTQLEVTQVLAEASSISEASVRTFRIIASEFGWQFAALWIVDSEKMLLTAADFWHEDIPSLDEFEKQCRQLTFMPGEGLPGKVWSSGQPIWIEKLETLKTFPRLSEAVHAHLKSGLCFPIMAGNDYVGTMEFLSTDYKPLDHDLMTLISDIGVRLGFFIHRKWTEKSLFQAESRLQQFIGGVKDYAVFFLDKEGNIMSWNEGAKKIEGYEAAEVIGKNFSIFYTDEANARRHPRLELELAAQNGRYEEEGIRVRSDGSTFWANVLLTAIYDENHKVTGYAKITRDVTDRKNAEEKLKNLNQELERRVEERSAEVSKSESLLRLITDALPLGVVYVEPNYKFRFVNHTYAKWINKHKDDIVGSPIEDIIGARTASVIIPFLTQSFEGHPNVTESSIYSNRKERLVRVQNIPDISSNGTVRGVVVVLTDITNQKYYEQALKKSRAEAEAANEAKSAFLANMSHEIRTPLGAVLGFSELIMSSEISDGDKIEAMNSIKRNGELLSNIINDILDLSKVEAGKLRIDRKYVSLDEILTDITQLLNLKASEKGLSLQVIINDHVPKILKTDPLRLRQILVNIVGNAIKFTPQGSVTVTISPSRDGRKIFFAVQDTGIGISASQVEHLFQPFSQADISSRRSYGGTGLGLVLSKNLASLLGGDVVLKESTREKGSTFLITIDSGIKEHSVETYHIEQKKQQEPAKSQAVSLAGIHVLLVEDVIDNQVLVSRFLTMAGASVDIAENGLAGLEKTKHQAYDLILMDLQMPIMDGYRATAEIRKLGIRTPIVALTAHALKEEKDRALQNGFTDYLSKPVNRKSLIEYVARYSGKGSTSSPSSELSH